jgi:HD superfamily phosphohydrolase YqeK
MAYKDLDLTFKQTLRRSSEYVLEKGGKLHPLTIEALHNYSYQTITDY